MLSLALLRWNRKWVTVSCYRSIIKKSCRHCSVFLIPMGSSSFGGFRGRVRISMLFFHTSNLDLRLSVALPHRTHKKKEANDVYDDDRQLYRIARLSMGHRRFVKPESSNLCACITIHKYELSRHGIVELRCRFCDNIRHISYWPLFLQFSSLHKAGASAPWIGSKVEKI